MKPDTIRRRFGWEAGIASPEGGKPKGMHWRTFERLKAEHDALANASWAGMAARLGLMNRRLVFNVLSGNTDDHAPNHAAFWGGSTLRLTPAYDICPQARTGGEVSQGMIIRGALRHSRLALCIEAASHYLLDSNAAEAIVAAQVDAIRTHWDAVCDEAEMPAVERVFLRGRQFLNAYAFD